MTEQSAYGTTPPAGSASVPAMLREVDVVQQRVIELRKAQSTGRWWLAWTTVLVILMFAAFSYFTYHRIRDNFNSAAVQKAVNDRGVDVLPLATNLLMQTGQNSMPVYRDALVAALHQRGPEMAAATQQRFEQVPEEDGKLMQTKLQASFANVIQRIEPEFKTAFPSLSDDRRQQLMQAFVMQQIDEQNKRIAARATALYTNDLIRTQTALEKFQLPDPGAPANSVQGNDALEQEFLHTMVQLLDDQVDAAYSKPPAPDTATMHASAH